MTIPDVTNHSVRAKESCSFGKQDSISAHPFELAQTPNFKNHIDFNLFPEIELENEYDPEPQHGDSILLPNSIMTLMSSPDFNPSFEFSLDYMP